MANKYMSAQQKTKIIMAFMEASKKPETEKWTIEEWHNLGKSLKPDINGVTVRSILKDMGITVVNRTPKTTSGLKSRIQTQDRKIAELVDRIEKLEMTIDALCELISIPSIPGTDARQIVKLAAKPNKELAG